jgi:hypothetical protein
MKEACDIGITVLNVRFYQFSLSLFPLDPPTSGLP